MVATVTRLGVLVLALGLSACAQGIGTGPSSVATATPASSSSFEVRDYDYGSIPQDAAPKARERWREVTECAGVPDLEPGSVLYLHAFTETPSGACFMLGPHCVGGYYQDSAVHVIGDPSWSPSWKHEMVHLLLDRTTGDLDAGHKSRLFQSCA